MLFKVEGMSCGHCKMTVEKALESLGYDKVKVNLKKGEVKVKNGDYDQIKKAIEESGYKVLN